MNSNGADARDGENRKRTYEGKLVNGERTTWKDAGNTNASADTNGAVASIAGSAALSPEHLAELPPELVHVTAEFYHPLGKLIERVSQETFNGLNDTLRKMSDIAVQQQANGVLPNGMGGHAGSAPDNSEANIKKKMLLMNFAKDTRAKFIKLLVLVDWGKRSADDISKVIDLFSWTKDQTSALNRVDVQMEWIKMLTAHARKNNPDIRTALEILSKGKAEWIPDMGLIPPEPMSSERALRLLKYMNTSLSIRLTVHENLPRHLKKWRVASGRVTFTIDSEFEMDLMTFSEDTSEPWLFIDLRLLLTAAPVIAVNARFLGQLKPKLDEILRDHGISGCFDFLHNFVLTHKIAVLRSQAYQLARGEWMGSIRVEPVHRSLVVQYWTERPGKKSWIEFGISSGKSKNAKASWRGPALSTLAVRWFRHGVEMKDADLQMDFKNLSMEQILKMVVALHVKHYLQTTRDTLSSKLVVKMILSELEPRDCTLEVSLGRPEIKTKLSLEPVTGRYILQPCTAMSARAEQNVNAHKDPLSIMGGSITYSLALTLQDRIQRHALQLSWQIQTKHIRADAVKQITGLDVLQFTIFYPSGWTTKWGLAGIIDTSGETWWNLELGGMGTTILYAEQVKMEKNGPRPPINRATLSSLERLALQQLCFCVTKRELDRQGISGSAKVELGTPSATSTSTLRGWVMLMRTSDLLKSKFGDGMWLEDRVRLVFSGFSVERREVLHIATATMVKSAVADMQKLMSASGQSNFTFSDDGEFSILLKTKFGEHVVDELKARLRDIDRLRAFTTTLQKRKMVLRAASMQQVKFQYGTRSIATVNFSDDQNITVSFDPRNAHNRILKPLVEIINERPPFRESPMPTIGKGSTGLDRFCTTLILTRPMVASLSEIENATPGNSHNPSVHTHSIGHYTIAYTNPVCSFEVHLRSKDDKIFWHIEDNDLKNADSRPGVERNPNHRRLETLKTSMLAFFKRRGERWFGVRTGILAELDGIQNALKELHQTVTSCSVPEGAPTSATAPSTAAATVGHNSNAGANAPPPNRNHRNSVGQRHSNNKQPPTGPDNKLNFPNLGRQGPQIGGNKPGHKQVKNGEPHEVIELD